MPRSGDFHIVPSMNSTHVEEIETHQHGEVKCGTAEIPLKGRLQSFDGGESYLFTLLLFARIVKSRASSSIKGMSTKSVREFGL